MKTSFSSVSKGCRVLVAGSLLLTAAVPAHAVFVDPGLEIPIELLSFGPLAGTGYLPLTSAGTTSTLPDAPATEGGYGWVRSDFSITLSSQRATPGPASTGQASLSVPYDFGPSSTAAAVVDRCIEGGMSGDVSTGDDVCVSSYFSVFFDVNIADDDSTANFFGSPTEVILPATEDIGPAFMEQAGLCIADTSQPNLGCLPPEGDAYIGHFNIEITDLPDINGDSLPDTMTFTVVTHQVGNVTDTYIDGAQVIDTFDSTAILDGEVNPPFQIIATGPTTAAQGIVYGAQVVPEPASIALLAGGIGLLGLRRRRK